MEVFKTKPKQWGNSLGITIPSDVVKKEHLKKGQEVEIAIIPKRKKNLVQQIFGTMPSNKSGDEIMRIIDEGL